MSRSSSAWRWVKPLGWAAIIAITSNAFIGTKSFSAAAGKAVGISSQSFESFWETWWWLFVKGYHFLEFALLFWLLLKALRTGGQIYPSAAGWALGASAMYAALDEFHQSFISYRGGRVSDVVIDCAGIATAALISWGIRAYKAKRSKNSGAPTTSLP